jgi:hypothetical protein
MLVIFGRPAARRQLEHRGRTPGGRGSNMATKKNLIASNYGSSAANKAAAKLYRAGGHKIRAQRSDAGKKRK